MAERYIRPPLHATERPSRRAAAWRFRIVFAVVVLALAAGVFLLYRWLVASPSEGSPSVAPPAPITATVTPSALGSSTAVGPPSADGVRHTHLDPHPGPAA